MIIKIRATVRLEYFVDYEVERPTSEVDGLTQEEENDIISMADTQPDFEEVDFEVLNAE